MSLSGFETFRSFKNTAGSVSASQLAFGNFWFDSRLLFGQFGLIRSVVSDHSSVAYFHFLFKLNLIF